MDSLSGEQIDRLLHDAREGDDEALGRLMEVYRNYVAMLARLQINHRLQGKVSPSDVVQETFLEARRCFSQFRGSCEGELVTWLRTILASRLAGLVRHYSAGRRNIHLEQQLHAELDASTHTLARSLEDDGTSPSERAVRREQAVLLADALAALAADYREVIVLRHLEGLSFSEVASRMDRTVDSVKNLWTRAITKLRQSLGATQ